MDQGDSLLLFYRRPVAGDVSRPGTAAIGRLDANGAFTDLATHTGFDDWLHIVPVDTTHGRVLFHHFHLGPAVGEVGENGSYTDVQNQIDAPFTNAKVVSTRDGILVFYSTASEAGGVVGFAVTGRLEPNGSFFQLGEPRRLDQWTEIVPTVDGLTLFYNNDNRAAATARITTQGAIPEMRSFTGFDPWTHIVSTSDGILLFYNGATGAALSAMIDGVTGDCLPLRNLALDPGWGIVAPTTNGLLLFYRGAAPTAQAAVGRVDRGTGAFFDVAPVNGLERWDKIVAVRSIGPVTLGSRGQRAKAE